MLSIAFWFEIENNKLPIQPSSLSPSQIEVLEALLHQGPSPIWYCANAFIVLRAYQLPARKEDMLEYVEKAKASKDLMEL